MEKDTKKTVIAGADKDLMFLVQNMDSEDAKGMIGMITDSPAALEMVLRRVHQLKDNARISDGTFNAFSKKLHDAARNKGTIQPGQQIIAEPLSRKEADEELEHGS